MHRSPRIFLVLAALVGVAVAAATGWAFTVAPAPGGSTAGTGSLPEIIGGPGTAPGRFYRPRGITCDSAGNIYNVDQLGRVQVFDPAGTPLCNWSMPELSVGKPEGLAIDLDGNLVVTDTHYSRVIVFSPDGREVLRWGRYGVGPGEFTYPLAVVVDRRSGRLYVSEYGQNNDRIQVFTRDGAFLKSWGGFGVEPGQFRRPSGLALGPDGHLYVADAVNHRIQVFTVEGALVRVFGQFGSAAGDLAYPYDVAVSTAGVVLVCEFGNNRVQAFTAAGRSLGMVGQSGEQPGQLGTPWCLTLDADPAQTGDRAAGDPRAGRIIVSDTLNHRLCRWRIDQIVSPSAAPAAVASPAGPAGVTGTTGAMEPAGAVRWVRHE